MFAFACPTMGPSLLWLAALVAASAGPVEAGAERPDHHGFPLPHGAVARMGMVRLRHSGSVHGLVFSPDGKTLASRGNDPIRIWAVATGRERYQLIDHFHGVCGFAFSADSQTLTSACCGVRVCAWDMTTGKQLAKQTRQTAHCQSCVLSRDGKLLALNDEAGWLAIWDITAAKGPQKFRKADSGERVLAISADNRLVASGGDNGYCLRVWEAATGKEICLLQKPKSERLYAAAFSPSGKTIVSGGYGVISVWALAGGTEIRQLPTQKSLVWALAFSADGDTLASGCSSYGADVDGSITIWQAATGKKIRELEGHVGGIDCLAFAPDGKTLASGGWDHTVRLWDVATGAQRFPCEGHVGGVRCAALSPDGKILASGGWDCSVRLWNPATGRELHHLSGHLKPVLSIAFSRDGKTLVTGSADDTTRRWDVSTGKALTTEKLRGHLAEYSSDGKVLAWVGRGRLGGTSIAIHLEDTATHADRFQLEGHHEPIECLAFSPDGELLASTAGRQPRIHIWHVPTGKLVNTVACGRGSIDGIRFSAAGRLMMARCDEQTVQLWETATWREIAKVRGGPGELLYTFVSLPDDRVLAMSCLGSVSRIRFWDTAQRKEIGALEAHQGSIGALCVSADGKTLISASGDSTLLAWDLRQIVKVPALPEPAAQEFPKLWADLLTEDAARAHAAGWSLIGSPQQAVVFLKESLRSACPDPEERIPVFLRELDADHFEIRDAAANELRSLAGRAQLDLLRALKSPSTLEFRRRVEQLLEALPAGPVPPLAGESLRRVRAIAVLKHIANPEAIALLKTLAARQPQGREAHAAHAALASLP